MSNKSKTPGILNHGLYSTGPDTLIDQAHETGLTNSERELRAAETDLAWDRIPFVSIRANFMDNRPGLDLPYPEEGEIYGDYYRRIEGLTNKYDQEREE